MALEAQDNPFPYVTLVDTADPSTPAAGTKRLWVDTDDVLKIIDEAAAVTAVSGAAHAASHENGGSDEIDVTGLVGAGAPSEILSIPTAETDDTLVLAPDGAGGVEFRAEGSGGITHVYAGYNTVGGTWETGTTRKVYAKSITLATDGLLTSIQAYVQNNPAGTDDQVENISVAIYTDNAGAPDKLIQTNVQSAAAMMLDSAAGATGDGAPRWFGVPIGKWLTAGTYWIAVGMHDTITVLQIAYDATGADRTYTSGGAWFADWGFYSPTTTGNQYSIRASIIT